jgi:hypothetical protein
MEMYSCMQGNQENDEMPWRAILFWEEPQRDAMGS